MTSLQRSKSPSREFARRILKYPSQQFRNLRKNSIDEKVMSDVPANDARLNQRYDRSTESSKTRISGVSSDYENPELKGLLQDLEQRLKSLYDEREQLRSDLFALGERTAKNESAVSALQRSNERLVNDNINERMTLEIERRNVKAQLELAELGKRAAEDDARTARTKLLQQTEESARLREDLSALKVKVPIFVLLMKV